jgi:hypothetical protein
MHAAGRSITAIVGAGIAVVAVDRVAGCAGAVKAGPVDCAFVVVIAQIAVLVRNYGTISGFGIAGGGLTDCCVAGWLGAGDDGFGIDFTLVGQGGEVADQGSVAEVVIFQGRAVGILLTIARDRSSGAVSICTLVRHGAGVVVVTGARIGLESAASGFGARVNSAWVLVITFDHVADAGTGLTVVCHSARIVVIAGPGFQVCVRASFGPGALIFGAVIPVIAQGLIFPLYQVRFVGFTVAVIVSAVALF